MKIVPDDVIGVAVNRVVCTEPPARYYPSHAHLILDVANTQLLGVGVGTIRFGKLEEGKTLYSAVAWQHTEFLTADELQETIAGSRIKRLTELVPRFTINQ